MFVGRKIATAFVLTLSAALILTGCGGDKTASEADDNSLMTVNVFDAAANRQGIQKGWFAKIVKDKFNMKLNIISPNVSGSTIFDTRSASGDLGDVIIYGMGGGIGSKLVKSNLISDMTPYMKNARYIKKYKSGTDYVARLVGEKGIWGVPTGVSSQSPTDPSEGVEPETAPFIRWDYYSKIGYPQIKSLDEFLNVMKQMQDMARKDTGENDIYAMSLIKDWDANGMHNAQMLTRWFGYYGMNSVFTKFGSKTESITQKNGIYEQALQFLNKAQRMGLIDPESSTQTYDNLTTKVTEGKVLVSFWNWLGQPTVNTQENLNKGVGFMLAPLQSMKVYSGGFATDGTAELVTMLGAKARNKQRLVNFIDWLYSPSGMYAVAQKAVCPEKMCWNKTKNGNVLTEFGQKAIHSPNDLKVPKEYGSGGYIDGSSMLNVSTVSPRDVDPSTKETFDPNCWKSQMSRNMTTKLYSDWSSHMDGAVDGMNYLQKKKMLLVTPVAYDSPEEDSQMSALRKQIETQIINSSWQSVFAENKLKFNSIFKGMRDSVNGLGYQQILGIDMKNARDKTKAENDLIKQYRKSNLLNN